MPYCGSKGDTKECEPQTTDDHTIMTWDCSEEKSSDTADTHSEDGAIEFSKIMELMENKDITLDFAHGQRPFKVLKDGNNWILEQQENYESSVIKDEGDNKLSVNEFPNHWPINGTWKFSIVADGCKISHTTEDHTIMTWDCSD